MIPLLLGAPFSIYHCQLCYYFHDGDILLINTRMNAWMDAHHAAVCVTLDAEARTGEVAEAVSLRTSLPCRQTYELHVCNAFDSETKSALKQRTIIQKYGDWYNVR